METRTENRFEIVKLEERIAPLLGLGDINLGAGANVGLGAAVQANVLNLVSLGVGLEATAGVGISLGL
jgi:hypothetical protein